MNLRIGECGFVAIVELQRGHKLGLLQGSSAPKSVWALENGHTTARLVDTASASHARVIGGI
jgi:hypothetical protein